MLFNYKLRILREQRELPQKDVAKSLGISKTTYCNYEAEKDTIPIKHLNSVCNTLNVSLDYALGFTELNHYPKSRKDINKILSGQRLKELRKGLKLTQEEFGQIFKCSASKIRSYEKGTYIISTMTLYKICKKYNISADYLLGKIDSPKHWKK